MRTFAILGLLSLAACDPFVASLDEPRVCATVPSVPFVDGQAKYPIDLSLGGKLKDPGVSAEADVVDVTLVPTRGVSSFDGVTAATLDLSQGTVAGSSLAGATLATGAAPTHVDGGLIVAGNGTDIYPAISEGTVTVTLSVTGASASDFAADVTTCLHVSASGDYL